MKKLLLYLLAMVMGLQIASSQDQTLINLTGSAFIDNSLYEVLKRICDEADARMMGNPQNERAVEILVEELKKIGAPVHLEKIRPIAWTPGESSLKVTTPFEKELKAFPSTQCVTFPEFEGEVVYAQYGFNENYKDLDAEDKIVLVIAEAPPDGRYLLNMEQIEIAKEHGAKAIIIHHKFPGTMAFSTSGNYNGLPLEIPTFNISWEEGRWIARLLEQGITVTVEGFTNSYLKEIETNNVVVTFPGRVKDKYILGCHFDSAERGQGAFDNGAGSAVAFEVARLLNTYAQNNYYTIEIVWFNGEETGLWGSKKYMEEHRDEPIRAVINMDMIASPAGFNTSGFNEYRTLMEELVDKLNGFDLNAGVTETLGTNSDHVSFYREGIPVLNIVSHRERYPYYHELGDTFDKVSKKYFSEAAAVVSVL